ncbi:MAG TPA: hypothetical protein PLI31_06910, partial [Methanoregulaceae archaeon]|nr:hypothetical protein [Methanoregulaceae archaeon]
MRLRGPAILLPADVDTDLIIAGRYLRTRDPSTWVAHAFEDLDPTLAGRLAGTVLVAGPNFGCGSSREQAARALRDAVARLRHAGVTNGSVVVIENRSAAVRALVGSADFANVADQGQVNGAIAPRSPGSALKPFTYALAFELGLAT